MTQFVFFRLVAGALRTIYRFLNSGPPAPPRVTFTHKLFLS